MLEKLKIIMSILWLALCLSVVHAAEVTPMINVLFVDDTEFQRCIINRVVEVYNRKHSSSRISLRILEDGDQITLESLVGIHLVLCDINMSRENGDKALRRLVGEAKSGFNLPPFIATTSDDYYHNIGAKDPLLYGERLAYAEERHFSGGSDKMNLSALVATIAYCEEKLGADWLITHVGRLNTVVPTSEPEDPEILLPTEGFIPVTAVSIPKEPGVIARLPRKNKNYFSWRRKKAAVIPW